MISGSSRLMVEGFKYVSNKQLNYELTKMND